MPFLPSLLAWLRTRPAPPEAVLLDIDGVLIIGGRAVPGAVPLLEWLRAQAVPVALLTNNARLSAAQHVAALAGVGLGFAAGEVVSCGHVLAGLLPGLGLSGRGVFVMGELGCPDYVEEAGARAVRDPQAMESCLAVVVGEGLYDYQAALNAVLNLLLARPALPFLVPNPDLFFPQPGGRLRIGPGGVAACLLLLLRERGLDIEPRFLGKPHPSIYRLAFDRLEARLGRRIEPARALVIGDSLASDVAGGGRFGCPTALVLTGLTPPAAIAAAPVRPDVVFEAL